ncbi:hypothetical protein EJB05_33031, partial [Eragrostis curvula]
RVGPVRSGPATDLVRRQQTNRSRDSPSSRLASRKPLSRRKHFAAAAAVAVAAGGVGAYPNAAQLAKRTEALLVAAVAARPRRLAPACAGLREEGFSPRMKLPSF